MKSDPIVTILMGTYNGEQYLRDQLDSLLKQTYTNWELLIRDDGSTDHTIDIIKEYQADHTNISLVRGNENQGSLRSFSELLRSAQDKPYVMFCDQDDYWLPDKIQLSLTRLREEENKTGNTRPVLLYSNLTYADRELRPLDKVIRSPLPDEKLFNRLMIQNRLWGCTMLLNNRLLRLAQEIPCEAENHDYWVALVGAAFGQVIHLDRSTLLYRQHAQNISGQYTQDTLSSRLNRIADKELMLNDLDKKHRQMKAFMDRYESKLDRPKKELINGFLMCFERRSVFNLPFLIKNQIYRRTLPSSILYYYYLIRKVPSNKIYT
jgi:rhamnosyltransferase